MTKPTDSNALWLLYRCSNPHKATLSYHNRRLLNAAQEAGLRAELVDPKEITIDADANRVFRNGQLTAPPRFLLPRSSTKFRKSDRALIGVLEQMGSKSCPTARALSLNSDKMEGARSLIRAGLPMPTTLELTRKSNLADTGKLLGFPMVLKQPVGSKGEGVWLCKTMDELSKASAMLSNRGALVAQRFVSESQGRDLRVLVLGGKVVGAIEHQAQAGEFRSNTACGGSAKITEASCEAKRLACAAAKACELSIAGVDLLYGQDGLMICEVNSGPGFKALDQTDADDIAARIIGFITGCS